MPSRLAPFDDVNDFYAPGGQVVGDDPSVAPPGASRRT